MRQPLPKRVLVPLDGSSQAEAALEEAFRLFPETDVCALHVVQVTNAGGNHTKSGYELAIEVGDGILRAAEEIAAEYGRYIETDSIEGNAAKTIVRYVEEYDIDHIVIGSRCRSGFKRLLFGSVSEAVVRDVSCPITVVPIRREESVDRAEINRVLVPVDESEEGTAALQYAVETFPDAEFTVIHVIDPVKGYSESHERPLRRADQWQPDRVFETGEVLTEEHDVSYTTLMLSGLTGSVPDAILTCAEDVEADLIVVGNRNRARLREAFLGSVSEAIVRRSSVPVTIIQ